jgi:cell division protein FtsN
MSDFDRDRGAYAPSGDAPLAFDARDPNGRGEGGGGRPPTTLIVSAGVLLVLVLALIFYYRSGVRHTGQPPVVGQPLSDIKQAPPASSQPADAAAGLSIYSAEQNPAAAAPPPKFTPAPEEPQPRPAAPTVSAQPAPAKAPAPAPASTSASAAASGPVAATPAPAPAATLRPTTLAPAPPTPVPTPAAAVSPAGSGLLVQIGAFSSPALADKGWNDVARLLPGQMVGRTKKVEPVPKGSETLYRAYIGGFGNKAEAAAFCSDLKAAGHACFVK